MLHRFLFLVLLFLFGTGMNPYGMMYSCQRYQANHNHGKHGWHKFLQDDRLKCKNGDRSQNQR